MVRPLIVGQAPSQDTDGAPPFSGKSGRKLARLAGVDDLNDVADLTNLVDRWPGKNGKGDAFPAFQARVGAVKVFQKPHRRIVAVGMVTARYLGVKGAPLEVVRDGDREFLVFPHPSGVSRWWNDPGNEERATAALRSFLCAV